MWKRKDKPSDWRIRNTRYAKTKHTDCKRLGEASEAEFLARATRLLFRLAKPWGESDPYDALVAIGRGLWRVQVKCASMWDGHSCPSVLILVVSFDGQECPSHTYFFSQPSNSIQSAKRSTQ